MKQITSLTQCASKRAKSTMATIEVNGRHLEVEVAFLDSQEDCVYFRLPNQPGQFLGLKDGKWQQLRDDEVRKLYPKATESFSEDISEVRVKNLEAELAAIRQENAELKALSQNAKEAEALLSEADNG